MLRLPVLLFLLFLSGISAYVAPFHHRTASKRIMSLMSKSSFTTHELDDAELRPASVRSKLFMSLASRRDLGASLLAAAAAVAFAQQPAQAERSAASFFESYKRYVPRIQKGLQFYVGDLKQAVEAADWVAVATATEAKGVLDRMFGPLTVFASAYSDSVLNDQTLQMRNAIRLYRVSVDKLAEAAAAADSEAVALAYKRGGAALGLYVEVANAGMPRGLDKLLVP